MDPLRDNQAPSGSTEAEAADLLRACSRYVPPGTRKQRVRAAITARNHRRPGRWLRPVLVTGMAVLVMATAGSSLGRTWVRSVYQRLTGPATPAVTAPSGTMMHHRPVALPSADPAARQIAAPTLAPHAPAHDQLTSSAPQTAPVASRRPHALRSPAQDIHAAASAEDAGLVVAAMQALRSSADPVKAGALLDEYLRRHPRGILAEEALTLAIEAAQARSDARARALAQQYLQLYPTGAYAATARQALQPR